jgi:asparagine synthase (glutamine-hydrolysing)
MCGIAGVYSRSSPPERREQQVRSMLDSFHFRGPDAAHVVSTGALTIGFLRLAIVGEPGPDQPHEAHGIVAAINGEIYNHVALCAELPERLRPPSGKSDCAVVPALYARHGDAFVDHLDGIFAGALHDGPRERVVLFRDHVGVKPLHWCPIDGGIAFASSTSALVRFAGATLDPDALRRYLATGYVEGSETLLAGICDVPPGTVMQFDPDGACRAERRWFDDTVNGHHRRDIRSLLERSITSETPDDGPVHTALSGGVDSTLTTLVAARRRPDLTALTVVYEDAPDDPDRHHARRVARERGIHHEEVAVRADDYLEAVSGEWVFDQPLSDPNALAFARLCRQVSDRGGKVLLTGDGADELFCGYPYYLRARRRGLGRLAAATFTSMSDATDRRFVRRVTGRPFGRDVEYVRGSPLRHMQRRDIHGWLEANLLEKADRFAMAYAVEVRVPWLRRDLVRAALALPDGDKIGADPRGKAIIREQFRDVLPAAVAERSKVGFGCPLDSWLRGRLGRHLEAEATWAPADAWDVASERRLWREHLAGEANWGQQLWRLAILRPWWRSVRSRAAAGP